MVKCGQKPHAYGCQTLVLEHRGKTIFQRDLIVWMKIDSAEMVLFEAFPL